MTAPLRGLRVRSPRYAAFMRIGRLGIVVVCAFALAFVACDSYGDGSEGGTETLPTSQPPWGLDGVDCPTIRTPSRRRSPCSQSSSAGSSDPR